MKKIVLILFILPLSLLSVFGQTPPVKPAQVGTGSSGDAGKPLVMDANGRGTLGDANLYWKIGGNTVAAHSILGTNTNYPFSIYTNNSNRIHVLENGNVGIGTTTPRQKIDIYGGLNALPTFGFSMGQTVALPNGVCGWYHTTGTTSGVSLLYANLGDYRIAAEGVTGLVVKKNTNYVGIGTDEPTAMLDVSSGTIRIRGVTSGTNTDSIMTLDASGYVYRRKIGDATGWTQSGSDLYNTKLGNVGFGTNNPTSKIHAVSSPSTIAKLSTTNHANSWKDLVVYSDAGGAGFLTSSFSGWYSNDDQQTLLLNGGGIGVTFNNLGKLTVPTLRISTGAANGYIATSDGSGNLSWVSPTIPTLATVTAAGNTTTANIGLGITPSVKLSINSGVVVGTSNSIRLYDDGAASTSESNNSYGFGLNPTTGRVGYTAGANGYHSFFTQNTERLRINVNGTSTFYNTIIAPNLQVSTGAATNSVATSDASGNLAWSSSISESVIPSNIVRKNGTNTFTSLNTFSDVTTMSNISGTDASFSNPISVGNATSGLHAMNRNSGDIRYAQIAANNTFTGANIFSTSTFTELKTTNGAQPSAKFTNTSGNKSSSIWITSNMDYTTSNYTANGDIAIDPTTMEMTMTKGYKRQDFHFETNGKQLFNTTFTDGSDSCFVTVSPTTRYLRVYKSTAVTTTKARINLPAAPQNNTRITILVETDPTSIDVKAENSGQSILSAITRFTVIGTGDVIECCFDSTTEGSTGGKWYVKKL